MVLKEIDNKENEIETLNKIYNESKSEKQKALIMRDLKNLEKGYLAEKENAWYLDFHFRDNERLVLLHDIRLEHNNTSAQMDHILITPFGITILESKSAAGSLTINSDNSISVKYSNNTKTFPNPVEQNIRHMKVLSDFLRDTFDMPTRLKLTGGVPIDHKVLIHPETTVTNKNLPDGFIRSDSFVTKRDEEIDKMNSLKLVLKLATVISKNMTLELAKHIIDAHKPVNFDYSLKYRVGKSTPDIENSAADQEGSLCPKCKVGTLVTRKRKSKKFGSHYASDEFLGCSSYPKCRYTEELT